MQSATTPAATVRATFSFTVLGKPMTRVMGPSGV
jgi:hypothetical protein